MSKILKKYTSWWNDKILTKVTKKCRMIGEGFVHMFCKSKRLDKRHKDKTGSTFSSNTLKWVTRRNQMKKFISQNCGRFAVTLVTLFLSLFIAACGGGGGGGSAVSTTPPVITSPVVLTASLAVGPSIVITASGKISSVGTPVVTLATTGAVVPVNMTLAPDGLSITLTSSSGSWPAGDLVVTVTAQPASGGASVTLGPVRLTGTAVTCTSPAMANSLGACVNPPAASGYSWNSVLKVWVADIGTTITSLNTLPDACLAVGDACWKASTANGTIKYISSNVVYSGRKVIFAGFIIGPNSFGAGNFNMKWVYADAEGETPAANKSPANGFSMDGFVNAKGSDIGVKYTMPSGNCGEFFFNGSGIATRFVSCPI